MHYTIDGYLPRPGMGMCGFNILLHPGFKDLVKTSFVTTSPDPDALIRKWCREGMGVEIIGAWGLRSGLTSFPDIRWGEWGPEHISVPGNACGLDLSGSTLGAPDGGAILVPHNVDSTAQAGALLSIFTWFANMMWLDYVVEKQNAEREANGHHGS